MNFSSIFVVTAACSFLFLHSSTAGRSPAAGSAKAIAATTNATGQSAGIPTMSADNACSCAVFLTGQFVKGSSKPPTGYAPITAHPEETFGCTPTGVKLCTNKCLESLGPHLSNSPAIICGSVDHDIFKEKAFLFIKNCNSGWINTHMSAGREFCCKKNEFYKCPYVAP